MCCLHEVVNSLVTFAASGVLYYFEHTSCSITTKECYYYKRPFRLSGVRYSNYTGEMQDISVFMSECLFLKVRFSVISRQQETHILAFGYFNSTIGIIVNINVGT